MEDAYITLTCHRNSLSLFSKITALPCGKPKFQLKSNSCVRNKIVVLSQYKFVLSFENNNVTDYVTEKMMNVIQGN
jgi:hypothetical protein